MKIADLKKLGLNVDELDDDQLSVGGENFAVMTANSPEAIESVHRIYSGMLKARKEAPVEPQPEEG